MTSFVNTIDFNQNLIDPSDDGRGQAPQITKADRFMNEVLISVNGLSHLAPREYLVKDLLLFGQVSMLAGPPNTGKTSIITLIAGHAALGEPIGNRKVAHAPTLYVAAEDPRGVAERGAAVLGERRREALPFDVLPCTIDLTDCEQMEQFGQELKKHMAKNYVERLFLVFDTLNLCLGDGDENSSRDMGKAISNARKIAERANVHVMIVHHTTHSDPAKPRGSTAMIGNCDTLLVLGEAKTSDGETAIAVYQQKQRSLTKGEPVLFQIAAVDVGFDTDGDAITLPMAVPVKGEARIAPTPKGQSTGEGDIRAQHLIETLRRLDTNNPGAYHAPADLKSEVAGPFTPLRGNNDSLRKAIARAIDMLEKQNLIEKADNGALRVKT